MAYSQNQLHAQQEYLAKLLAERLSDPGSVPFYLSLAKQYPAGYLFQVLGQVMEVPPEKIRKSRAALFTWLIRNGSGPTKESVVPDNLPIAPPGQDHPVVAKPDWPELDEPTD